MLETEFDEVKAASFRKFGKFLLRERTRTMVQPVSTESSTILSVLMLKHDFYNGFIIFP